MTSEAALTAVRQQIAIMGCDLFELGIFWAEISGTEARMLVRAWEASALLRSVRTIRRAGGSLLEPSRGR